MRKKTNSLLLAVLLLSTSISLIDIPNAHATEATGGVITYDGDYTIHTFTTSGTFTVTAEGDVEYLVVGGGGAGAWGATGGGGAGGYRTATGHAVTVQGYSITIGAGGVGCTSNCAQGGAGGDSIFDTITSLGGAGGAGNTNGLTGGSGGGASQGFGTSAGAGTGGQGFAGGAVSGFFSGGGGGATEIGSTDGSGEGGDGLASSISGASVTYAGGGGGGVYDSVGSPIGGDGGGGDGGSNSFGNPTAGTANTGGGGGGGYYNGATNSNGADGGSGIVIIKYLTPGISPDAITDLTFDNLSANEVDLIWTLPGLNGGNLTNYMVNSTTPWSSTTNFLANTTNVFYNVTGLTWGTDYSFSVSALTEGGYNFTGNVLNITTTSTTYSGISPTDLTVNDCYHTCTTQLNLEWLSGVMDNINGYRIFMETPIGGGFTAISSNTTTTTTYYNNTGLNAGQFYNYKVAALNGTGISDNSTAYAYSPHKLPDAVDDLAITANDLLQFLGSWSVPNLFGTLNGYQVNYTTPAGDPQTIYTSTEPTTSTVISGLNPTVEYSFRVSANTIHGTNTTGGNIANATASSEIAVGDLSFDPGNNQDVEPIWYENYIVDDTTNNVQVRYDSALTVDCTITERIANNVSTYTGLSETAAVGYVYHNFTVTNAGNDILDWDCYDQTDSTINGQYALSQSEASSGVGGAANIPMFSLMANFTGGLYGTEGEFAGIDLITLFIVIISMLGFNKKNPALGVGIMATLLGAAWYYELIPWTSGVLGGIAVVVVLAIGQGLKKD